MRIDTQLPIFVIAPDKDLTVLLKDLLCGFGSLLYNHIIGLKLLVLDINQLTVICIGLVVAHCKFKPCFARFSTAKLLEVTPVQVQIKSFIRVVVHVTDLLVCAGLTTAPTIEGLGEICGKVRSVLLLGKQVIVAAMILALHYTNLKFKF